MNRAKLNNLKGFIALSLICSFTLIACEREPRVFARNEPSTIEERYGLAGAYSERVSADDRVLDATIVPVTLSDGRTAQLVVPKSKLNGQRLYFRDGNQLIPVALENPGVTRDEFIRSQPRIVERRVVDEPRRAIIPKKKRSLQKELLIVGGSAGGGAAIGALAGGKKGAAVGAVTGGVAGLIYDLATRNK
jgi:hypothetical protein